MDKYKTERFKIALVNKSVLLYLSFGTLFKIPDHFKYLT